MTKFFEDIKGNKSSKRLIAVPTGYATLFLGIYAIIVCVHKENFHYATILLFGLALFYLLLVGIITAENIVQIVKNLKQKNETNLDSVE